MLRTSWIQMNLQEGSPQKKKKQGNNACSSCGFVESGKLKTSKSVNTQHSTAQHPLPYELVSRIQLLLSPFPPRLDSDDSGLREVSACVAESVVAMKNPCTRNSTVPIKLNQVLLPILLPCMRREFPVVCREPLRIA